MNKRFFAIGSILLLMLLSYPLSKILPVSFGWENGVIESVQMVVLFLGLFIACYFAYKTNKKHWRWFAFMIIPIWLILIGREWSWGAVILMPPLFNHPETGPFYSSQQLTFRQLVRAFAVGLLLFSLALLLFKKQYKSIPYFFKQRIFPTPELLLAFTAAICCTLVEGGAFSVSSAMQAGQQQALEELLEICAYLSVLLAQHEVLFGLRAIQIKDPTLVSRESCCDA